MLIQFVYIMGELRLKEDWSMCLWVLSKFRVAYGFQYCLDLHVNENEMKMRILQK